MKILFLGTSAGWPLPRLGCKCPICTSQDPKDKRTRPSILVNDSILIDAGPDLYWQLAKIDATKITTCFITHNHPDHTKGLWDLPKIYNRKGKIQIFRGEKTKGEVHLNNLIFQFFPVEHAKTVPSYGLLVGESQKKLAYISDFKKISKNSLPLCKQADLLTIDGSSLDRVGETRGHETIIEGLTLGKKLQAKQVYFTHLGHKTGKHRDLEKFVQQNGGKNFHIAYDGLELNL